MAKNNTPKASKSKSTETTLSTIKKEGLAFYKIGENLRKHRKEKGLKLLQLSNLTKISMPMLSKIENGRIIPTIPTLFLIINQLNLPLDEFFSGLYEKSEFPGFIHIPQSAYVPYVKEENAAGFEYYSIMEHVVDRGPIQISLLHLQPKSRRASVKTSAYEFIFLISGSIKYSIGEKVIELHAGDSLFFNGSVAHRPLNDSKNVAKLLVVYFFNESETR